MRRVLPDIIREVGFEFRWDNQKVWALEIPVEEMPASELVWHFEIPFLATPGGFYDLTPREVLENRSAHEAEYSRTLRADLNFPIDIMSHKGRWVILDGLHRLMRATMEDKVFVKVRKVGQERINEILKEE